MINSDRWAVVTGKSPEESWTTFDSSKASPPHPVRNTRFEASHLNECDLSDRHGGFNLAIHLTACRRTSNFTSICDEW